jgi:hypothetical protein
LILSTADVRVIPLDYHPDRDRAFELAHVPDASTADYNDPL